MNIKNILKKSEDLIWNTGAFFLSIAVQQLVILPYIAAKFTEGDYSRTVLFTTVFNIVVCVFGEELGNVYLTQKKNYESRACVGDYPLILAFVLLGAFGCGMLLNFWVFKIDILVFLGYCGAVLGGVLRYFLIGCLRGYMEFRKVFGVNSFYVVGALCGLALLRSDGFLFLPFLLAETCAVCFALLSFGKVCGRKGLALRKTELLPHTVKKYTKFGLASAVVQFSSYVDRLLVNGSLGSGAASLYYSATSVSKITALLMNPLSSVLLARLSGKEDCDRVVQTRKALLFFGTFGMAFAVNALAAPLALKILYSKFFDGAIKLVIPVSVSAALGGASSIVKPTILRYYSASVFIVLNLVYAGTLIGGILLLTHTWGLTGYVAATVLARGVQGVCYLSVLLKGIKSDG